LGLLDFFKPSTKAVNRNLFSFLLGSVAPDMTGIERLEAYKGWVYACVNDNGASSTSIRAMPFILKMRSSILPRSVPID